jgi:site-specific recombinase XerD
MKLIDAVKGYLLSRKGTCNEKTMRWYRQKLALLCAVLEEEHNITRLEKVTVVHLRLFIDRVRETNADEINPHKPTREDVKVTDITVKGYVQVVKGFFNWCFKEELIKKNPVLNLENPKVGRYVIKTFTEAHINDMLHTCDTNSMVGFRDYTIMLLLLDTGIRVSELCGLALDRVYISVTSHAFIKVMGKGRKEREVGISTHVAECLWKYINVHRKPKNESERALFINVHGYPLTLVGVEKKLRVVAQQVGITGVRVSPHTFRHTFSRMFLENGGDVYKLSLLLGHSSVTVTENYLKDFESRNARLDQSLHSPVEHLKLKKSRGGFQKKKDILG